MPFWEKKPSSVLLVLVLVLVLGLLVFMVTSLTCSGRGAAEKNDLEHREEDALTLHPGDGVDDDCRSKATTVVQMLDLRTNLSRVRDGADQNTKAPAHEYMEKRHATAIYVYTNAATILPEARTGGRETSLYFDLSEAIQILRHGQVSCLRTHYSTDTVYYHISNGPMRFSSFLLSSLGRNVNSSRGASCFHIHTCFGAEVTYYSAVEADGQVLIPPYEVFNVAGVQKDSRSCNVVYTLESDLDCVYDRESNTLHPISALSMDGVRLIIIIVGIIMGCVLLLTVLLSCELRADTVPVTAAVPAKHITDQ